MRMIYIAHPFGGEKENVDKVEKIVKGLIHKHPDCTFYSPLHATGFMYSQLTYLGGMEHCVKWVIVGAESGNRKDKIIPKREWIENIVSACRDAKVPVFMKNSLKELMGDDFIQEWPEGLR